MPEWGSILNEVTNLAKTNPKAFDIIRNKYLKELHDHTKRNVIIYVTKWTSNEAPPNLTSITDEDIHAFMQAIHGLEGKELDLILHTPGGSPEAADAIVSYLRQKFDFIRIIIPQAAMSAGTMLCCAADEIVMGKHSSLGPIDPQFILKTAIGITAVPAHAIIEQFDKAQKEISQDPKTLNSWLPMLSQYGPALLIQCKNSIEFGQQLVEKWLNGYMFKNDADKAEKAKKIAEYLSNHSNFKTHAKHLNIEDVKALGLNISELESDQKLQERVLSAFHASMITLNTGVVKIVSNHNGNAYLKQQFQVVQPSKK